MTAVPSAPMWLASTEHVSWGEPRRARARRLVYASDDERDYLWLLLDPVAESAPDGHRGGADVVVAPRFERRFRPPTRGHPVQVRVWASTDRPRLETGRFEPPSAGGDAWCTLYASYEEADTEAARSW